MQTGRVVLLAAVAASLGASLGACAQPAAPGGPPVEKGVCYHMVTGAKPTYEPVEYGLANLETCATRLEARRLMLGQNQTGVFEGRYIFATADEISSGAAADGSDRRAVFSEANRQQVDKGLQILIDKKKADDALAAKAGK